jgi:hypothetical protein
VIASAPTDDRLGAALASLADSASPTSECPLSGDLWDLASGTLARGEARRVAAHAVACAACREALLLAREVGATGRARPVATKPARTWAAWAGAAAILVAAVALFEWRAVLDRRPIPEFREPPSLAVKAESPLAPVPHLDGTVLRWTAVPAARYDVTLAREDLRVLAVARGLERPEYAVPAEAAAGLRPGERLLWQVEVILPDGRRARSGTFSVRIQEP